MDSGKKQRESNVIYGIGTDLVQISRIRDGIQLVGEPYLSRTFSPVELRESLHRPDRAAYLASRFAVKEAVYKALALPWGESLSPLEIETYTAPNGQPTVRALGAFRQRLNEIGALSVHATISYESECALAFVIIEA